MTGSFIPPSSQDEVRSCQSLIELETPQPFAAVAFLLGRGASSLAEFLRHNALAQLLRLTHEVEHRRLVRLLVDLEYGVHVLPPTGPTKATAGAPGRRLADTCLPPRRPRWQRGTS